MANIFKKLAGLDGKIKINRFMKAVGSRSEDVEDSVAEMTDEDVITEMEEELEDDLKNRDPGEGEWLENDYEEGQLSIDVYQTPESIVVKSTIAGVKPENLDISINNDMLTVRGKREMIEGVNDEDYLFKECYWGSFSRSIILPVEVEEEKIDAVLESGVLTITLPKAKSAKQISIKVKER